MWSSAQRLRNCPVCSAKVRDMHLEGPSILSACMCWRLAGPETEEAYRERHRWAAKRVAHLMRDLPATPPLEGAADLADSLQINIGLMVEGQGFPSWPAPDAGELIDSTPCCQGGGRRTPCIDSVL